MKYVLLVPDGAADEPLPELNGKTPLQTARTPYLDGLAHTARVGAVQVTPEKMYPGSDPANMALLGYDPVRFYTGRGPIEAAAIGVPLSEKDVAFRCSLVSTDGTALTDYSAGHISTEDARGLIALAGQKLGSRSLSLFPGVSYRHILRWVDGPTEMQTAAPHENVGKRLDEIWPQGESALKLRAFIEDSINLLDDLPINRRRRSEGKPPANMLWPWSPGRTPRLQPFVQRHGHTGAVIAAVDVIRGLGVLTGLEVRNVPGATGYFDTNYAGKGAAAVQSLQKHDFVWVHVEAPDEAGHLGSIDEKIRAIENIDRLTLGTLLDGMKAIGEFRLLVAPDHKTPIATRGHAVGPVPYLLYDSRKALRGAGTVPFDERAVEEARGSMVEGWRLLDTLFEE